MNSFSNTPTKLCKDHTKILTVESRIAPKIIRARGYYCSCNMDNPQQHLQELGYSNSLDPFMVIPLEDIAGNVTNQIRIDNPPEDYPKYLAPPGSTNILDIPPGTRAAAKNAATTLIITEGAKKADSINSALTKDDKAVAVSLSGVWNFRNKDTGTIKDIDELGLKNREVILAFDSDQIENVKVSQALFELHNILEKRKCKVKSFIPGSDTGAKVGVDDFLAAASSEEDHRARAKKILTGAVEIVAPEEPIHFDIVSLADVVVKPVEHLLDPYIEVGALSIFYGRGGVGKSLFTTHMVAKLSKQKILTYWLDAEDDKAILAARAIEANLDLNYVHVVSQVHNKTKAINISDEAQIDGLFKRMDKDGAKLLVINTLPSFMLGVDSNSEAQIKQALLYLNYKLATHKISALGVHHVNKNTNASNSSYRIQGSSAFHDVPRKVFGICPLDDATGADRELKAVGVIKANNVAATPPIEVELLVNSDTNTAYVKPTGIILPHDFHYYMRKADAAPTKTEEVKEKIMELLEDEMESKQLEQQVLSQFPDQPSRRTFDRAIQDLKGRGSIDAKIRQDSKSGKFLPGNTIYYKIDPNSANGVTEQKELPSTEGKNRYAKIHDIDIHKLHDSLEDKEDTEYFG